MGIATLPTGKNEFSDGHDWFAIASEHWVLNTINAVPPCLAATITNLSGTYHAGTKGIGSTLTSNEAVKKALVIDAVTLVVGSRVLVKNQTDSSQNGIYTVTVLGSPTDFWQLTRATDFDSASQMPMGKVITVIRGVTNAVSDWMLSSAVVNVDVDALIFNKLSQVGGGSGNITNVVGTKNQITVTVNNGVATVTFADNPIIPGTGSLTLPGGTTAQRPTTATAGMVRWNTSPS